MKKFVKNLAERIRMREISEVGYKEFSDYLNKMDDDEIIVKYGTEKELEIFFKIESNFKKGELTNKTMNEEKKQYPFLPPIEITSKTKDEDIFDSSLPVWVKKEMSKVAKKENCFIRELRCKREIYFEEGEWRDICVIIRD